MEIDIFVSNKAFFDMSLHFLVYLKWIHSNSTFEINVMEGVLLTQNITLVFQ